MNSSSPLRIGVAGLGHLGSLHAKMLSTARGCVLQSVYDVDPERCASVAKEYGASAARDLDELLSQVDAVSIATPTSSHFEVAARAVELGKHVFLEKPITETVQQARELNAMAEAKGVKVQVGHIERFNPAIVAIDTYNPDPLFVESHRLAQFKPRGTDVPVVLDLMIHDIDIILALVKSQVEKIEASGIAVISDSADIANARLQFRNGCVANITASRISQKQMRKMRLFQKNAYISIDFGKGSSEVFRIVEDGDTSVTPTTMLGNIDWGSVNRTIAYEIPAVPQNHNPLQYELQLFVDAVNNGTKPIVDGHAAQHALEVAEEIVRIISNQTSKNADL
jgi:predicted dehydrogenase